MSTLVTSYYHRYDEVYNELRYDAQFYGSAYYISLAGLITTAITLASILGEESSNNDYMVSFTFHLCFTSRVFIRESKNSK